jgi:flagellar biogenesis protein FliO
MLKKRILLLGLLLVLSIAGQILLRPCLGESPSAEPAATEAAPLPSDARSTTPEFAKDTPELQSELLRQFFYMLGFVALIGVGAWWVCRKLSCGYAKAGGQLVRMGETLRMGPRKAVHLIYVGKKTFLVASTSDSLCLLADVSDSVNAAKDGADE